MDYKSLDFTSRKKLLATLAEHESVLETELAKTKSASLRVTNNKQRYDGFLVAANTIRGVIHGLTEKVMLRAEASKLLKKAYQRITISSGIEITAAKKAQSDFEVEDDVDIEVKKEKGVDTFVDSKNKKKTSADDHDDTRIATQISNLRLYRKDLPSSVKGVYGVAHLPVIPIFRNLAISNVATLKDAGFKTLHFAGNDLEGYVVLDKQAILMLDYKKYNSQFLAESQEEYESETEAYKKQYAGWKAKFKAWQDAKESYDDASEEYQDELIKFNKVSKQYEQYKKLKADYPKLKAEFEKQMNLHKAGKLKVKPEAPKLIKPVKVPVKPEAPVAPTEEFETAKPIRPKKPVDFDTGNLSEVVNEVLHDLSENTNAEYSLMSDEFKRNPKNGDLLCFWIVEKWKIRNLDSKFGRATVDQWGFPF